MCQGMALIMGMPFVDLRATRESSGSGRRDPALDLAAQREQRARDGSRPSGGERTQIAPGASIVALEPEARAA